MFCQNKNIHGHREAFSLGTPRVFFFPFCIEPILEQPRMGPFWRVSVNRDDPQARLPPVEAILFLPRAPRMHAQSVRGHEKHHGRKCAARVRFVCWHSVACGVRLDRSLP